MKAKAIAIYIIIFLSNIVSSQIIGNCTPKVSNFTFTPNTYNIDYNIPNAINTNKNLVLKLTQNTGGTRITLNNKLHYGIVEAKMRISPGSNVISSFILMADNGDEIDFEFVGKDPTIIQTNYFYRGIPIYSANAKLINVNKRLDQTYNIYTINWTPTYYEWKYNGISLRKLYKNQTKNYPDTISRVQFGIWQANNSDWAGNGINWNKGPFNSSIEYIKVICYAVKSINKPIINATKTVSLPFNFPSPTYINTTIASSFLYHKIDNAIITIAIFVLCL